MKIGKGAKVIAPVLGLTEKQFYHAAATGKLDGIVGKLGDEFVADLDTAAEKMLAKAISELTGSQPIAREMLDAD
jgi:hypothetical protein